MATIDFGYFRLAKRAAEKSEHPNHRLGCVVVKNKRPISFGWNQFYKTHPKGILWGHRVRQRLCAEVHACKGLTEDELRGTILYVWRSTAAGNQGLAKPCMACQNFLVTNKIKRVYYSTSDGFKVLNLKNVKLTEL